MFIQERAWERGYNYSTLAQVYMCCVLYQLEGTQKVVMGTLGRLVTQTTTHELAYQEFCKGWPCTCMYTLSVSSVTTVE